MGILAYGVRVLIPEANLLQRLVADCIVGYWKGNFTGDEIMVPMSHAMEIVEASSVDWDLSIVSSKDLRWSKGCLLALRAVLINASIDFIDVLVGC